MNPIICLLVREYFVIMLCITGWQSRPLCYQLLHTIMVMSAQHLNSVHVK